MAEQTKTAPYDAVAGDAPTGVLKKLARLKLLFDYAKPYKVRITAALVTLVIAAWATLEVFSSLQPIIDEGFAADNPGAIDDYFLTLLAIVMVLAVATALRFYFVTTLGERVVADIRKTVQNHLLTLEPSFFEENRPAEISTRLTTDTTLIQTVVGSSLSIALRNLLMFIGGVIKLLLISPKLLGLAALVIPLVIGPMVFFGRKVRALSRSSQDRIADVGAMATETLGALSVVQANTHEMVDRNRFSNAAEDAYSVAAKRVSARSWMTLMVIVLIFGAIDLVLWQGAKDVIAGKMTGGEMAAFVGLAIVVAGAVGALSEVFGDLMRAAGAAGRIRELLASRPTVTAPANPRPLPEVPLGTAALENVSFAYPSRPGVTALDGLSLHLDRGETVALVGPSGAGKSTVLQLLLRFFDPQSGRVVVDGVDVRELDPKALRQRIAVVPQDTVIFADTVRENIRYGRIDASDEEVEAAARAAVAHDFIMEMPGNYDSPLGERGVRLSGGQRQRIAIARAILRDAPILLLDEATSALDARSEKQVQEALTHLMENRSTIVIAHRLATVLKADRIIVMDRGQVVATGKHEELLAQGGLYARLADLQFNQQAAQ